MGTEENLYPRISGAIKKTGAVFPEFLANNFKRVLQRIEFLWGENEAIDYFDSLFLGDIPDDKEFQSGRTTQVRQGFSIEAVKEIVMLKQVHQLLYPSANLNPYDPFSGSEIVPIAAPNRADASLSFPVSETSNGIDLIQPDSENAGGKSRVEWPVIHTQHELGEVAELKLKGENIYPTQGKPVGEILLHYGAIDEHILRVVRDMQKRSSHKNQPLGEILVSEIGIIRRDDLTRTLLIQAGVPMVDAMSIDIPPEIAKTIPLVKAREKLALPIGHFHDKLYLAVADPFTFADQSFFTVMTGMKVILAFAPLHDIVSRINMHCFAQIDYGSGNAGSLQFDRG